MTREEYELKKQELLKQKYEIENRITRLSEEFHTEELADYQRMYNGKFILSFAREPRLKGCGNKILTHYSIYYVEAVKFVGFGFFRFKGKQWEIDCLSNHGYLNCDIGLVEDDDLDVYLSQIDGFISNEEAMTRLSEAKNLCCKICDSFDVLNSLDEDGVK